MPSLQLFQLTQNGRNLLSSRRRALALASSILVAGGTAAYMRSRLRCRIENPGSSDHYSEPAVDEEKSSQDCRVNVNNTVVRKTRAKKRDLSSLKVLTAILLSRMGKSGASDFLTLAIIVVLRTALNIRLAKVQGFLFRAAFLRQIPSFLRLILENIILCFLRSTLSSTSKYITGTLSLHFRKILTDLIHADYFENMAYYKMSNVDSRVTNPEQRIASDIPRFCSELSDLVKEDLAAVIDGFLYTWRLCSYTSPKYFFWILAYVTGAGIFIENFSPAFGNLMSKEQQLEGEYRQLHSRLRTHAESIAFYGGEKREESHIQQKFNSLVRHMKLVHHDHWWFGMIQDFLLKYLDKTVAVFLTVEPFFSGNLRSDTSTLGRAEMLSNLRYHTSVITSLFQALGDLSISSRKLNRLSGYAERIHELMAVSRELSTVHDEFSVQRNGRSCFTEANYIEFANVKVVTPTNNVLVEDLSLRIESGTNLLITGPNGSGKSSLFRVLGGLWPLVSGYIAKPGVGSDLNKEIFYVPQRPYTSVGTLRDQLIYPLTADEEIIPLTHSGIIELLKNVDLEHLLDRYPLEREVNWGDELSLGEQQRLGMARLFYHKPRFAILDECTSAVTTDMEERFCAKVRAMGTSCITISHRPALVTFHDLVLSLDGEGGWNVCHKREGSPLPIEAGLGKTKSFETDRQSDAMAVQHAFATTREDSEDTSISNSKVPSYVAEVVATSHPTDYESLPVVRQLQTTTRALPLRIAVMFKVLVPTLVDKQGAQFFAVALLVMSRTWITDRIASLNGNSVKFVLEQDKAAFLHLTGVSILQSAASSIVAPSLRYLKAKLALGWRILLTQHLLQKYLRKNTFYKVFHNSAKNIDADQRITHDVEKLTTALSGLVTGMVKPSVDILWFTWRMKLLTGQRGILILYAYMLLGLGFLRSVTPDFSDLTGHEQQLEGTFRFMHERLRTHAESIAFFGGGAREKAIVDSRFRMLLHHSKILLKKKWLYGIVDDFITQQLPHNVTWGLSLLYALEHKGDQELTSTQGDLAHSLRFLASVVSQSFLAFGDILELHRKFLELSGGITRIFELDELLGAAESEVWFSDTPISLENNDVAAKDIISFSEVDIITPTQKLLARKLTCDIVPGRSMLVTGPNGSGKSSVFRVLHGLWPTASGRLTKPFNSIKGKESSRCGVFYIPQRPYTCLGSLRDQIIYPLSHEEAKDIMVKFGQGEMSEDTGYLLDLLLRSILENVRLIYLLEREGGWDATVNWEDVLSLGEQQRLGMARLFFHRPRFGILDECTNATSVDVEEQLYKLAQEKGITVVTTSQRPALISYHSMELRLVDGEGKWELRSIKH